MPPGQAFPVRVPGCIEPTESISTLRQSGDPQGLPLPQRFLAEQRVTQGGTPSAFLYFSMFGTSHYSRAPFAAHSLDLLAYKPVFEKYTYINNSIN